MGWLENVQRAKKPQKLPVVFTKDEVRKVMAHLAGTQWIMANLLYGSGLRLMECLRLRVKDIDFGYHQITVREGKGNSSRSGSDRRVRRGLAPLRAGKEISECQQRMGLAVCVSVIQTLHRSPIREDQKASC